MNILFLYGNELALDMIEWLESIGQNVVSTTEKRLDGIFQSQSFDAIISYTYKYLLCDRYIDMVNGNAVNIHISYLPWNRGANPNQWSVIENTPKGVTMHYMTNMLDGGDIISQELVSISEMDTLASSYLRLHQSALGLLKKTFPLFDFWDEMRKKPLGKGSYHSISDFETYQKFIQGDYNVSIKEFLDRLPSKPE